MNDLRVRFAPSPTGNLHIGGARTALFNYLFAQKNGGKMVLRIEDTDKERSRSRFEENILDGLRWLSLNFDELYRQSDRRDKYRAALEKLVSEDKAYVSKEEEGQRQEVIRLYSKGEKVTFTDLIRGEVETDTTDLGDFVIAKSFDEPVFHFANVYDDGDMKISHIIRGEDHISNTARQILIQEALGFERPTYAHIPLILSRDRSKMSKRDGGVEVLEYKSSGYIPEAFNNYLALLGWNPGTEREIYTTQELIEEFDLQRVQKGGAVFDIKKLNWINKNHLGKLTTEEYEANLKEHLPDTFLDSEVVRQVRILYRDRIEYFGEIREVALAGEMDYLLNRPQYGAEELIFQDVSPNLIKGNLESVVGVLEAAESFEAERLKETIWPLTEKWGRGETLHPYRLALTGLKKSPDPFTLSEALGKDETISRLKVAISKLSDSA